MQTVEVARNVANWYALFGQEKSALVVHTVLQTCWTNLVEVCVQHLWRSDRKLMLHSDAKVIHIKSFQAARELITTPPSPKS